MDEAVWGWKLVLYLWVAALAGGTYMCAMLITLWAGRWYREIVRAATFLTIPLLVIGAVLLAADLGQPTRFWHLLASWRPSSPMWVGTYILVLGSIVGAGLILHEILDALKIRVPGASVLEFLVTWVGLVCATALVIYVAVLLTATSRAPWSATTLLPPLFVASGLSMGAASILLTTRYLKAGLPPEVADGLRQMERLFILFEGAVLAILMLVLAFFSTPSASRAVYDMLAAPLGAAFWLGVVIMGILAPLALEFATSKRGLKPAAAVLLVGPILTLAGSLVLRYVVVFGGQMQGWISRPPI